jgi:hypothetical protein
LRCAACVDTAGPRIAPVTAASTDILCLIRLMRHNTTSEKGKNVRLMRKSGAFLVFNQ